MISRFLLWLVAGHLSLWATQHAQAQDWIYHALPGDTLWDLCLEYTARPGCWLQLGDYNSIANDRRIKPGTEIRIPAVWLLELPVVGTVLNVQGEVNYQKRSGTGSQPLLQGQDLVLGSLIKSTSGTARIRLSDGSEVLVRPESRLELKNMSGGSEPGQSSQLNLDKGEVEVEVRPQSRSRFEIQTPSAIAAVRGTEYRVVSQGVEEGTRSEVLQGIVAVKAADTRDVGGGFGIKAKRGESLGEPRKLLDAPVFDSRRFESPLPVMVAWSEDADAVEWQLDVYLSGAAGELIATYRSADNRFEFAGIGEGCYRVVVRGIDAEGFNGLDAEVPLCVQPQPPVEEEPRTYWDLLLWSIIALLMLV